MTFSRYSVNTILLSCGSFYVPQCHRQHFSVVMVLMCVNLSILKQAYLRFIEITVN